MRETDKIEGKIKCIRTDCDTGKVEIVELEYYFQRIKSLNNTEWLNLIGGPTGYEGACVEEDGTHGLRRWAFSLKAKFHKKYTWVANFGAKTIYSKGEPPSEDNPYGEPPFYKAGYDKLEVPASEIRRILKKKRVECNAN